MEIKQNINCLLFLCFLVLSSSLKATEEKKDEEKEDVVFIKFFYKYKEKEMVYGENHDYKYKSFYIPVIENKLKYFKIIIEIYPKSTAKVLAYRFDLLQKSKIFTMNMSIKAKMVVFF